MSIKHATKVGYHVAGDKVNIEVVIGKVNVKGDATVIWWNGQKYNLDKGSVSRGGTKNSEPTEQK